MLIFTKYLIVKKYIQIRNNNIKIRLQIKKHTYKDLHTKKARANARASIFIIKLKLFQFYFSTSFF